jgi:hypothetical protein
VVAGGLEPQGEQPQALGRLRPQLHLIRGQLVQDGEDLGALRHPAGAEGVAPAVLVGGAGRRHQSTPG